MPFVWLLPWVASRPACEVKLSGVCTAFPHMKPGEWFHDHLFGGPPAYTSSTCNERGDFWRAACKGSNSTAEHRYVISRYGNLCGLDCEAPTPGCPQPDQHHPEDVAAASGNDRPIDSLSVPLKFLFASAQWANRSSSLSQACLMGRGGTFLSSAKRAHDHDGDAHLFTCLPKGVAAQLRLFDVIGISGALLWSVPKQHLIRRSKHKRDTTTTDAEPRIRLGDIHFRVGPTAHAALNHIAGLLILGNSVSRRLAAALDSTLAIQHRPIWADTKQYADNEHDRQETLLGGGQNFTSRRVAFWWWPDKMCDPPPSRNVLPHYTILHGGECTHTRALEQAVVHFGANRTTHNEAQHSRPLVIILGGHLANIMQCDLDLCDYDLRLPSSPEVLAFETAVRTSVQNFIRSWSQSCPKCLFIWKLETSIGHFDRERGGKKFCSCKQCSEEYLTERAVRWNRIVAEVVRNSNVSPTRWLLFDTFISTARLGGEVCAKKDAAHWLAPARLIMTQQLLLLLHTVSHHQSVQ